MNEQVRARIDKIMKHIMIGSLAGLAIMVLWASLSGCKPAGQPTQKPIKTAIQPPAEPSWPADMDPACRTVGEPVAWECIEGHPEWLCPNDPTVKPVRFCWWAYFEGDALWYQP